MNIDVIKQKSDKIRQLEWLVSIAQDYSSFIRRIDSEKDFFRVSAISFQCRSDGEVFHLNPHRTISFRHIRDGLAEVLLAILDEIETLRNDIENES